MTELPGSAMNNSMKVAIVGGSLGGLAAANVLYRQGMSVTVFEKSDTTFENRGACLGFVDVDLLQSFRGDRFNRHGRQASLDQGAFYYGDVWQYLFAGLPEGMVRLGYTVETLGDDIQKPEIDGEAFDIVIIADGGWSTLREKYFDDKRQPEYTGHQIYWASVDTDELPGGLSSFDSQIGSTEDATYSNGIYDAVILEAPKCNGSRMYACGFFIATPESEIEQPEKGENRQVSSVKHEAKPEWFLPFVRHFFRKHAGGEIVRFTEACDRKGKIAPSPIFEYAVEKTVKGRLLILGDAAHLSTPWTAAGAYTAMLDAKGLRDAFTSRAFQSGGDIDCALESYDKGGIKRAKDLLSQSRACSRRLIPKAGKNAITSPSRLVQCPAASPPQAKLERIKQAVGLYLGCGSKLQSRIDLTGMKVGIVGGSLIGLAAGNVFHRLGATVSVYEKYPHEFDKRGACLGFVDIDLWEQIRGVRMIWPDGRDVTRVPPPDGRQSFENQGSFYYGDMWRYLYSGLPSGCVKFNHPVHTLGEDPEKPAIDGELFDVAIIADGGWSLLRGKYFGTKEKPEYTGYQIFWGRVDAAQCGPSVLESFDGRTELIGPYAAVTLPVPCFDGRRMYMAAFFIPTPEDEIHQPTTGGDNRQLEQTSDHGPPPEWFLPFVRCLFGQHAVAQRKRSPGTITASDEIVQFAEAAARVGKITACPVFEFGVQKTVMGRVIAMGDAAHMASPMTAAGAHTGMQDALALWNAFSSGSNSIVDALRTYDKGGIRRTKDLLATSRACSSDLVPRGGRHAVKSPSTLLSEQHTSLSEGPQFLRLY